MALVRTTDVLTSKINPFPRVIQFLLSSAPWISFLQSLSLFLITSLHSEFDKEYRKFKSPAVWGNRFLFTVTFFQPYAFSMVGAFTFLEMLIDLLHDAFDGRFVFVSFNRDSVAFCAVFVSFLSAYVPAIKYDFTKFSCFKKRLFHEFFHNLTMFFLQIQTPRFYIKSIFFVTFSACFPHVILTWMQFQKLKRCHAYGESSKFWI